MELRIGTCGWVFDDWNGPFYPPGTKDELAHYTTQFSGVEIDSTWYHIPSINTVKSWHKRSPADFIFCPKLPGEITHDNLLQDSENLVAQFLEAISHLQEKLGCILVQLSPRFTADELPRLQAFLSDLPDTIRYAVEFRHRSWIGHEGALSLLEDLNMAVAMAHHPYYPRMQHVTCDFVYIRLLGRRDVFPDYRKIYEAKDEELRDWAEVLRSAADDASRGFVFINNQFEGHSPATARKLIALLESDVDIPMPPSASRQDDPPRLFD